MVGSSPHTFSRTPARTLTPLVPSPPWPPLPDRPSPPPGGGGGGRGGRCRHPQGDVHGYTLATAVFAAPAGTVRFSYGPPSQGRWRDYAPPREAIYPFLKIDLY